MSRHQVNVIKAKKKVFDFLSYSIIIFNTQHHRYKRNKIIQISLSLILQIYVPNAKYIKY